MLFCSCITHPDNAVFNTANKQRFFHNYKSRVAMYPVQSSGFVKTLTIRKFRCQLSSNGASDFIHIVSWLVLSVL